MVHHGEVVHRDADHFAALDHNLISLADGHPVDAPGIAIHIACEIEKHVAHRRVGGERRGFDTPEVGVVEFRIPSSLQSCGLHGHAHLVHVVHG